MFGSLKNETYEKYEAVEPFIILPYGSWQNILYFSAENLKAWEVKLIESVYKDRGNLIIRDNLIKVIYGVFGVIILHIYPIPYKDMGSGRGGQNLVVGFLIYKSAMLGEMDQVLNAVSIFFRGIEKLINKNVPSYFVSYVNSCNDQKQILDYLEKLRGVMQNAVSERKKGILGDVVKRIDRPMKGMRRYDYNLKNGDPYEKLGLVYKVIRSKCWHIGVIWIVVNDADPDYYYMDGVWFIRFG